MWYRLLFAILSFAVLGCSESDDSPVIDMEEGNLYFPPSNSGVWETTDPNELGWNQSGLNELFTYLEVNGTRAFLILKDGKIVVEEYFGNTVLNTAPFDKNSLWYWASAGKALTATLVGIAQQEGDLDIDVLSSEYLGEGWTSIPQDKEQLIKVRHQLTMTTGLDYDVSNLDCTLPSCLTYRTDAADQWYYHNAPYTLLEKVVENATGTNYNDYTDQKIGAITGMNGQWISQEFNNVYWSTARDMARFGLLILNKGTWDNIEILTDEDYYDQMTDTSQDLNPSYGYLWWLNGKNSIIFPGLPNSFNRPLSENAPDDLFAGMGKNGQFVEVIPSKNMVVVRMGEAPEEALVPIAFHDEMWERILLILE
ncbi:MAG: serine hydrolase domain-containing protein [Bacteroidota bacterium]